jgi:hypothetical protein
VSAIEKPETAARRRLMPSWIGFVPFLIAGAAMGYFCAPVKTQGKPVVRTADKPVTDTARVEQLRHQVAVLTAEKNRAEAALAESQKRLKGCRRTIGRYIEELAHVHEQGAALQREGK